MMFGRAFLFPVAHTSNACEKSSGKGGKRVGSGKFAYISLPGNRGTQREQAPGIATILELTAVFWCQLCVCGEGLTFGNSRRRFLAHLLHGVPHGLLNRWIKSPLNHREQTPVLVQKVMTQPDDVLSAALHNLVRVSGALEQSIEALMKSLLGLLAGNVFVPHPVKGESNALHMFLKCGVEDLFFLHHMGVGGFGNFPPEPGQPVRGLAAVSRQAQYTELLLKFIQQKRQLLVLLHQVVRYASCHWKIKTSISIVGCGGGEKSFADLLSLVGHRAPVPIRLESCTM